MVVEVAKSLLRFNLQIESGADFMALERLLDGLKEILAADHELDGFVQDVEFLAQSIFECPGQGDHALLFDFHKTIVAVRKVNVLSPKMTEHTLQESRMAENQVLQRFGNSSAVQPGATFSVLSTQECPCAPSRLRASGSAA